MKRFLLITFLLLLTSVRSSAQSSLEKSILWEIKGKNLSNPSYLLGTFHLVCVANLHVSDKILTAMDEVKQIALEVNLADRDELLSLQELMVSPTTLSSQLSIGEQEEFRLLLKSKYGIDLETVDHLPSFFLMGILTTKDISCEVKGFDMEIFDIGLNKNKNFIGLERFKDQIAITNQAYTAKDILTQLREKEETEATFHDWVAAFTREDIEALYAMAVDVRALTQEMKVLLLDNRNRAWVEKMVIMMVEKPTLFAVGAGHLAGERGVIQLLRERGFTVSPVLN